MMKKYLTPLMLMFILSASAQDEIGIYDITIQKQEIIVNGYPILTRTYESPKWYKVTKNDAWIMGLQVVSGYAQGWREEALYHPYALMERFPRLDSSFWFVPQSWRSKNKFDANHVLKGAIVHMQIACLIIKVGDLKSLAKKDRWKKIVFDSLKYYGSYQFGVFLAYNVTHGNKVL